MSDTLADADDCAIAAWVAETCILFGAAVPVAHMVAALFIEGIRRPAPARTALGAQP